MICDNDEAIDVYVDEYLPALASIGEIQLIGMLTSRSVEPFIHRFQRLTTIAALGIRY